MPVFSNNDNQKMLAAIKECISLAKGCEPTNEEVWKFCKAFILLLFDMDCAESVEPEYFCSLIELCYKERNGEKREIELNKSLSDRLYEILFQFKVIPGIDWNGNFDAKRFDYWMKTVTTISRTISAIPRNTKIIS